MITHILSHHGRWIVKFKSFLSCIVISRSFGCYLVGFPNRIEKMNKNDIPCKQENKHSFWHDTVLRTWPHHLLGCICSLLTLHEWMCERVSHAWFPYQLGITFCEKLVSTKTSAVIVARNYIKSHYIVIFNHKKILLLCITYEIVPQKPNKQNTAV